MKSLTFTLRGKGLAQKQISVNQMALSLVKRLIDQAHKLQISVEQSSSGATLIDMGIDAKGGFIAGAILTEICLGGLGEATIVYKEYGDLALPSVLVKSDYPSIAMLGSQLAGWRINIDKYAAIASGPARALTRKPRALYKKIQYADAAKVAILVLETKRKPPENVITHISNECKVVPENLYLLLVPTSSIAGSVQISGRVTETGIHRLVELGFDPRLVIHACGYAPIAPVHPEFAEAMGRTNDMIMYGGIAYYTIRIEDEDRLRETVTKASSSASECFGKTFQEIFKEADYDFYKIDPRIFSPAVVVVNNVITGNTFTSGKINVDVMKRSLKL